MFVIVYDNDSRIGLKVSCESYRKKLLAVNNILFAFLFSIQWDSININESFQWVIFGFIVDFNSSAFFQNVNYFFYAKKIPASKDVDCWGQSAVNISSIAGGRL